MMLADAPKHKGGNPELTPNIVLGVDKLSELHIDKMKSSRTQ